MKTATLKNASALILSLLGGIPGIASALSISGSLGATQDATDYYLITCPSGTSYLQTQITNNSASGAVKVQLQKDSLAAYTWRTNSTTGYPASGGIRLYGSSGAYNVLVDKNTATSINYTLQYTCKNGSGTILSGVLYSTKQNK